MPQLRGVDHPRFTRMLPTHYLLSDPNQSLQTTIHVGHIANILIFDVEIQAQGGITGLQTMPLGFSEFSAIWNMGAQPNDSCHISQVILATDDQLITPSTHLVRLSDFHVTPEQCGLSSAPLVSPATSESSEQAAINREVAAIFVHQCQAQCHGFKEHQQKRLQAHSASSSNEYTCHLNVYHDQAQPLVSLSDFSTKNCQWAWCAISNTPTNHKESIIAEPVITTTSSASTTTPVDLSTSMELGVWLIEC